MSGVASPKVAISSEFLSAFARIPRKQQNKVTEFIDKFRDNPAAPGANYEKIRTARDPFLRSVRIGIDYRAIVLAPESGDVYILLWVDHHDEAYDWASKRVCNIHPDTGSIQVVEAVDAEAEDIAGGDGQANGSQGTGLFDRYRDRELISLGVPEDRVDLVRGLRGEADLDAAAARLPEEAADALLMLAAGYSLEETHAELGRTEAKPEVDTGDFATALAQPDSQRRFYVVDDEMELKAILSAPLEKWRVFLHPSQRRLVERDWNGPVRVLGGAGTGKTVVAMHRAKWLVEHRCAGENDRVLLTTFTRNLAEDIRANLAKICTEAQLRRIEVVNLDRWVSGFLRKRGYGLQIDYGRRSAPLWERALALVPSELDLTPAFYREEWESVIQSQGITSFQAYARASRVGRGVRLNRRERKLVWPVFEEYRLLLEENNLREPDDAMRDARQLLEDGEQGAVYAGIVVDEAQDMGAEAFRLLRQLIAGGDRPNDLFIVGDAHQRIYRHKVILGRCGINIRGRSRRLRINYRTTEENRRWATGLLEGVSIDDLDGGDDDLRGYRSLLHGSTPEVHHFPKSDDEYAFITARLQSLADGGVDLSGVCIVARTRQIIERLQRALADAGIDSHTIHRSEAEDRRRPGVRLATMHRVKGLEFDRVILACVNQGVVPLEAALSRSEDQVFRRESEIRERALLYVAATRARNALTVTSSGPPSPFLQP